MIRRLEHIYLRSAFWIFTLSGLSKTVLLLSKNPALVTTQDPVFSYLSMQQVLLVATLLEFAVAMCVVSIVDFVWKGVAILGVSWGLVFYRLGLTIAGWNMPCNCLGNIPQLLSPHADRLVDKILEVILIYFLLAGNALWIRRLVSRSAGQLNDQTVAEEKQSQGSSRL